MRRRRWWLLAVLGTFVAALWLHWPSLDAGYAWDDFAQIAMLEGWYPGHRSVFDLYRFVGEDPQERASLARLGTVPWFAQPGFRFGALRPLSSLLIYLEHAAFGHHPVWQHLHSLGWLVGLLAATWHLLVRRLPTAVAVIALGIFALAPAHAIPVVWLANRAALSSACLGVLAISFHLRWRVEGWRPGLWLGSAGFVLALLAGEYGLSTLGYPVAHELFVQRDGWRRRWLALLPALLPAALYLVAHVALGYGVTGSSGYVDFRETPLVFAREALPRSLCLLGAALLVMPTQVAHFFLVPLRWESLLLVLALLLCAQLVVMALGSLREHRDALVTLLAGGLLSCLPLLSAPPAHRLLIIPSLGSSVAMAVVLVSAWARDGQLRPASAVAEGSRSRLLSWSRLASPRSLAAALLGLLHLGVAPAVARAESAEWMTLHQRTWATHLAVPLDPARIAGQHVFLLNTIDTVTTVFAPYIWRLQGKPLPASWQVLTMTPLAMTVTRSRPDEIDLEVHGGGMFELQEAINLRQTTRPLKAGEHLHYAGLDVDIVKVAGWGPSLVRYRFDRNLDDPSSVFLMMTAAGLERPPMPPVGTTVYLPTLLEIWAAKPRP